jgi:cell division protease FtsH
MNSNQPNRNRKGMGPGLPFSFWYILVAIGFLLVIQNVLFARPFEQLPYSDFKAALRQDRIEDVQISTHTIRGTLRPNTGEKTPPLRFMTVRVDDADLVQELETHKVKYTGQYDSDVLKTLLSWIVRWYSCLFCGASCRAPWPWPGGDEFWQKSRPDLCRARNGVTFADVAGVEEAKEELQEIIDFLRYPQKYAPSGTHSQRRPVTAPQVLAKLSWHALWQGRRQSLS